MDPDPGPLTRIVNEALAQLGDELMRMGATMPGGVGTPEQRYDIYSAGKMLGKASRVMLGIISPWKRLKGLIRGKRKKAKGEA